MRPWSWFLVALVLGAATAPIPAMAHPHVWVNVRTDVLFDADKRIIGVRHHWEFDEAYSIFAVQGLDTNGDGFYDTKELEPLAKVNIESLVEFDYFTEVKSGGKAIARKEPVDYRAEFKDGVLTLHFTLPLEEPIAAAAQDVSFAVYDPTFYVSFSMADKAPVRLASGAQGCTSKLAPRAGARARVEQLSEAEFLALGADSQFGAQFATDVFVRCSG